jgi:hypothetical protein
VRRASSQKAIPITGKRAAAREALGDKREPSGFPLILSLHGWRFDAT